MAEANTSNASGVQELITRIRDQGVRAGKDEANELVENAKREAAKLLADAQAEIAALRAQTTAEIQAEKAAALEALKLAARDTGLELQSAVVRQFEQKVNRLVSETTLDGEFLETLVLVLAGHSADEYIKDKDVKLLANKVAFGTGDDPEVKEGAGRAALTIASDMLREGVELVPASDIQGGVRVQVVEDHLEIDLTSEAVSRLLLRNLLPRFRALLTGAE
ncbi:MAG: hypothetical protein AAF436_14325 [Myxococcota bacterium]